MKILLFSTLLLTTSLLSAKSLPFDKDFSQWQKWGSGSASYSINPVNPAEKCVLLDCGLKKQVTLYRRVSGLQKGHYRISLKLRSLRVKPTVYKESLWIFYDSGQGTKTVSKNLGGNYEWTELSFPVEVVDHLNLWIRLKSAGKVWVDDVKVEKVSKSLPLSFEPGHNKLAKSNPVGRGQRCSYCYIWFSGQSHCRLCGSSFEGKNEEQKPLPPKTLVDFSEPQRKAHEARHYLRQYSDQQSVAIFPDTYVNLNLTESVMQDWFGYKYLEFKVYNPTADMVPLALSLGDKKSKGSYWNQLNHHTHIGPGWNELRFNLKRYVGERGSVRIKRYLDAKNMAMCWIKIGDKKTAKKQSFKMSNLILTQGKSTLKPAKGILLFDFVKDYFRTQKYFTGISDFHDYSPEVGFGFENAQFWNLHDSLYADKLNRDGVFINKGRFRVDLANGKYKVLLNINHLGEWYEHFWQSRQVTANGNKVVDEKRTDTAAHRKNFLRFSQIEPDVNDNPYDLYLKSYFEPYTFDIEVREGHLLLDFTGDNAAICLNSLIIIPQQKQLAANKFLKSLESTLKEDFLNMCRLLQKEPRGQENAVTGQDLKRGFALNLLDIESNPGREDRYKSVANQIGLLVFSGEKSFQALQLINTADKKQTFKFKLNKLTDRLGKSSAIQPIMHRIVYQYKGHSFNHETFELHPEYLKTLEMNQLTLAGGQSAFLWLELPLEKLSQSTRYEGSVICMSSAGKKQIPVRLNAKNLQLPPADIAIGFFGLDPIKYNNFRDPSVQKTKMKTREQVLELLASRGYNTFSELPGFSTIYKNGELQVDTTEISHLMKEARRLNFKKVFTYGGGFLGSLKIDSASVHGLSPERFHKLLGKELKKRSIVEKWLPIVVNFSDEAAGYSMQVERDLKRAKILEKYYPYLSNGGFTHSIEKGKYGYDLNQRFIEPSYSSVAPEDLGAKKQWGLYNQGLSPFVKNRLAFGQGLFSARNYGCGHLLQWYLTANQNYPYYDLDGREFDAMMIYPTETGRLNTSLKFEWSAMALTDYRLLLLLEQRARNAGAKGDISLKWLKENYHDTQLPKHKFRISQFTPAHGLQGQKLRQEILKQLQALK